MPEQPLISIIVPVYNEEANVTPLYTALCAVMQNLPYRFELIFIDDGSHDDSVARIQHLAAQDDRVKLIEFVRNFGKEVATTAGLNHCQGEAAILIDADLQHPPTLIPEFINRWQAGAELVVGLRNGSGHNSWLKKLTSRWFYRILNVIAEAKVTPNATDFRLLDRVVIDEFNRFSEHSRMTRGLIDWLGFRTNYIAFDAAERQNGEATYGFRKLSVLAVQSFVSLSLFPLKAAGYLGMFITLVSFPFGFFILVENFLLRDPWGLDISGTAMLAIMLLFLVGIILMSLGLIALYIATIHREVINRPLYVIRNRKRR